MQRAFEICFAAVVMVMEVCRFQPIRGFTDFWLSLVLNSWFFQLTNPDSRSTELCRRQPSVWTISRLMQLLSMTEGCAMTLNQEYISKVKVTLHT